MPSDTFPWCSLSKQTVVTTESMSSWKVGEWRVAMWDSYVYNLQVFTSFHNSWQQVSVLMCCFLLGGNSSCLTIYLLFCLVPKYTVTPCVHWMWLRHVSVVAQMSTRALWEGECLQPVCPSAGTFQIKKRCFADFFCVLQAYWKRVQVISDQCGYRFVALLFL